MKFLREPLVHFLLLGGLLFGVFAMVGKWNAADSTPNRIVVTPGMIENLKVSFQRGTGAPPNAKELQDAIDTFVREEILCREARALGVDQDDTVIRTILRQRMEYLAEGNVPARAPTEEELQAFLAQHTNDFKGADGNARPLSEVRSLVENAWLRQQRKALIDAAYEKMRARYRVTIQPAPDGPAKTP